MNKIVSTIKDLFPLLMLVMVLVLIFVPLPVMLIQVLIVLNLGFSLCLFLAKFFSKTMIAFHFPRLVLYFCVFICALIIATTRTFLAISSLEEQIPLVLIIGQGFAGRTLSADSSLLSCYALHFYCSARCM